MLRKLLLGVTVALVSLSILVLSVNAQSDDDAPAVTVRRNPAAANVTQTVPVTLTVTIPGPDGPVTVEMPIYIALDIRIGISQDLVPSVVVTPSVVTEDEATPTATADDTNADEATVEPPTATPSAATSTPRATTVLATATPIPQATSLPTVTPTATVELEAAAPLCPDPRAVIVSPGEGQTVSGAVNVLGTATHENFLYYKVEYAPGEEVDAGADGVFAYLGDARAQVTGGLLTSFNSADFVNGAYTLRLTVVDASGNFPPPCTVSIVVAN